MSLQNLFDDALDIALNEWSQVTDHAWNQWKKWWDDFSLAKWFAGEFPQYDPKAYVVKVGDQFISIIEDAIQRTSQIPLAVFARLVAEKIPIPPKLASRVVKGDDVLRFLYTQIADAGLQALRFNLFPPSYRIGKRVQDTINKFRFLTLLDFNSGTALLKTRVTKLLLFILRTVIVVAGSFFVIAIILHLHEKFSLISEQKELFRFSLAQDSKRVRQTLKNHRHRINAVRGPDK